MIKREHILAEIRRTANENGGKALGSDRFRAETGIRDHEWQRFWARWSDAVQEAGFQPAQWVRPIGADVALARLAEEVRRLGRMPTTRERDLRHREDSTFPSEGVFRRMGSQQAITRKLVDFCRDRLEFADVLAIVEPLVMDDDDASSIDGGREEAVEFGYVYLIRSGRNYKLGRTNALGRRERELAIQLPERVNTVHVIKTDDPPGIEGYWHRRFADRRKNGEWFELTPEDVAAFRRRKTM